MANVRPSLGHLCTSHSSASVVVGTAPKLLGKTLRILCIPPRAQNADQTCWLDTQRRQYSSADKIMRVYTIHFSKCWETHLPLSTHVAFSNGISMGPDSHFQMQDKIKVRRLRLSKMCSILSSHSKFWNVLIKHLAFFFFLTFHIERGLESAWEVQGTAWSTNVYYYTLGVASQVTVPVGTEGPDLSPPFN